MESDNIKKLNSIEEMFEFMDGIGKKRKFYAELVVEFLKKKDRRPC